MVKTTIRMRCFCVHTAEDGTWYGKAVQHWPLRLCRSIFIFMVIMMEEKLLESRDVVTHARGMMHQPMMTGVAWATIVRPRPSTINDDRDEAALLLQQRFQQPIGDDCNPIDSVANVDNVSTGQTLEVNNVDQANQEYEQQRGLTTTTTTTTNTAGAIAAVIPTTLPILEVNCLPWLINRTWQIKNVNNIWAQQQQWPPLPLLRQLPPSLLPQSFNPCFPWHPTIDKMISF